MVDVSGADGTDRARWASPSPSPAAISVPLGQATRSRDWRLSAHTAPEPRIVLDPALLTPRRLKRLTPALLSAGGIELVARRQHPFGHRRLAGDHLTLSSKLSWLTLWPTLIR